MNFRFFISLFLLLGVISCSTVDPTSMQTDVMDQETLDVPKQCERFYDSKKQAVAVLEYANKTTLTDAKLTTSRTNVAVERNQTFSSFEHVSRDLNPQLGEFAQGAMESALVSMGGVTVVARAQLEQILQEQQFQMTLADPETAVDFGMLVGAEYIVTGSVDNINVSYNRPMSTQTGGNDAVSALINTLAAVGSVVYNVVATTGWNVETEMTTNIIDVSTGQIIITKRTKGSTNVGDAPTFTMDQVVSGAKSAMGEALKESLTELSTQFVVNGYINEFRGNKRIARISVGSGDGIKENDRLKVYEMSIQRDFKSGDEKCSLIPMSFDLVVTGHVQSNSAWAVIGTKDSNQLSKIKIGSIVRRVSVKR